MIKNSNYQVSLDKQDVLWPVTYTIRMVQHVFSLSIVLDIEMKEATRIDLV